ncbi:MAG: hypothetical protein H0V36_07085 [Chloroflexi bacterium]|nr:hypothetical protein [Chloroflexota bacterium]
MDESDRLRAVSAAYDAHVDDVYRVASYAILHDPDDAIDVTQDVFVRAFEQWHRYDPQRPLRPGTSTTVTALEAEIARLRELRAASNNNTVKLSRQNQIQELNRQLDVAKAQTTDKTALIAALNGDLTKLQGELATLNSQLSAKQQESSNLQQQLLPLQTSLAGANGQVTSATTALADAKIVQTAANTALTDANAAVTAKKAEIAALEAALPGLTGDLTAAQAEITQKQGELKALEDALPGLQSTLTAANTAVTEQTAEVTRLDGEVNALVTKLAGLNTWLHAIAGRTALDRLRRRRVRYLALSALARADQTRLGNEYAGSDPASTVPPREAIRQALTELAPTARAAVLLRHRYGYDYSEIAEFLSISVSSNRSDPLARPGADARAAQRRGSIDTQA